MISQLTSSKKVSFLNPAFLLLLSFEPMVAIQDRPNEKQTNNKNNKTTQIKSRDKIQCPVIYPFTAEYSSTKMLWTNSSHDLLSRKRREKKGNSRNVAVV